MKKLLAILLVIVLVMGSVVVAFADTVVTDAELGTNSDATSDHPAYVNVIGRTNASTVYNVNIAWGTLTFEYNEGTQGAWKPSDHTYNADTVAAGWVTGSTEIVVSNHSNASVTITASFSNSDFTKKTSDVVYGVTGTISNADDTLESAAAAGRLGDPTNPDTTTYTVSVAGTPTEYSTNHFQLGSIFIKVAK